MQTWGFICLSLLVMTIPAYATLPDGTNPTTNPQVGGPIVPVGNSTQQQYCWNGSCVTPNTITNGTISGNDSNHEIRSRYNIIMIIPSEECTNAIKNHVKTNCPPLGNIIKYDTSNQKISGKFVLNKDGSWTRDKPEVKNHWQYYTYTNKTIVCVYCTGNYLTTDLYKTIIIESGNPFEYVIHKFVSTTYTISQYNFTSKNYTNIIYPTNELDSGLTSMLNRNIQGCDTATISYSDYLLNDTISYMESGCKTSHYNQTNTQKVPNTPWVYDNPYSSLHYLSSLNIITQGHGLSGGNHTSGGHGPGNCINGCKFTTSTKKPGW